MAHNPAPIADEIGKLLKMLAVVDCLP